MKKRNKCPLCSYQGEFMQMKEVKPREDDKEVDLSHLFGETRWQGCPSCELVFQVFEVDEKLLLQYYDEDYRLDRQKDFPHVNDVRVETTRAYIQYRYLAEELNVNVFIKSVLDIGCNLGSFLEYMKTRMGVKEIMGVEPCILAHTVLKQKNIPFVKTIYDLDDTQYDLINVSHVLEHFLHPLENLRDVLFPRVKPGRYIFLEVPNMNKSNAWCATHISAFRPETLAHMVTKAGFFVLNNFLHPQNQNLMLFAKRPI